MDNYPAWMCERYCPGHKETPEQEFQICQETSSLQTQVQPAFKWDNGIFTPSSNREGEVASIPLKQREEQRQAFSKEGGAGKQGGTHNLQS